MISNTITIRMDNVKPCPYCFGTGKLKAMQSMATYNAGSVRGKDATVKCTFCKGRGVID